MTAPFMHRCLTKPLGYPGDFEVMRFLYERHFEGATLLGKAIHLGAVRTQGGQAVRNRKDMLKRLLTQAVAEHPAGSAPLRIVSVAAGPAQEIFEFLRDAPGDVPPVEIVLFDQDPGALTFIQRRLDRLAQTGKLRHVRRILLQDSIRRLRDDPRIFGEGMRFDLIFSAGLFDYLTPRTAVKLIHNFHDNLAEGGRALIGNMTPINPCRWFLEHHLNWYLKYRDPTDLLEFGIQAAPTAKIDLLTEPTGINPFLQVKRA